MRLSSLDIKKQDFKRVMRGVDPEEVQAFLQMVAEQWQSQEDDQNRLEHKITELETKLDHYKQVEEALQEAVKTARESSRQTLDAAKAKAKSIVEAAADSATRIQHQAQSDHYELRRNLTDLQSRRNEVLARLRNLLKTELDLLDEFDRQYPVAVEPAIEGLEMTDAPAPVAAPVDDDGEAVQNMEALEEAALNKIGLDDEVESALSDDTLLFTDEDVADQVDVEASTKAPTAEQDSAAQVAIEPQSSAGSHRDSAEMDKIRKILDDLA